METAQSEECVGEYQNGDHQNGDGTTTEMSKGKGKSGAKQLASLYTREKRIQETLSVILGCILFVIAFVQLILHVKLLLLPTIIVFAFLGILTADMISGLVHWGADSWGTVESFIGRNLIRSFREHHIDPSAITQHDFIECNGDNFLVVIPLLARIIYQNLTLSGDELDNVASTQWFIFLLSIYISLTNQIHKWSHTYRGLPKWVEKLQDWHIILSRPNHKMHHLSPHDSGYCITTGWLNGPLDAIGFWRKAEYCVTAVTGMLPRTDDMKWAKSK